MEGKVDYRSMAKKYIDWGTQEIKQALLDKKGQAWMDAHWVKFRKARTDLLGRPTNDLKETIQEIKEEQKFGPNAGERVADMEQTLEKVGGKLREAIQTSRQVGGRLTQTNSELSKKIEELEEELKEERQERKRMQKQLEKQQEQINRLLKAVGIEKKGDEEE